MANELKFDFSTVFPAEPAKAPRVPLPSYGGDRPRVLVADEDPVHRLMFFDLLTRSGNEVVVCENGREAIQTLRQPDHPRLAILHWNLSGMSGLEICERMRQADKPVFLILNCDQSPTTQQVISGLNAGADVVLEHGSAPQLWEAQVKAGLRAVCQGRQVGALLIDLPGSAGCFHVVVSLTFGLCMTSVSGVLPRFPSAPPAIAAQSVGQLPGKTARPASPR
jgi:CheY-like chemotaxis protein